MKRVESHQWFDREGGAVAVIFAISALALIGVGMLAIDLGNLWQERRNLISGTDATALAVAQEAQRENLPSGDCSGSPVAADYLAQNSGVSAEVLRCEIVVTGPTGGYVLVEARKPSQLFFASVFGFEDQSAVSMTSARFGLTREPQGLRPLAICDEVVVDGKSLREHLADGTQPEGVFRIEWDKDNPNACSESGDSPGNWGYVDLDCSTNNTSRLRTHLAEGYDDAPECWDEEGNPPDDGTWWVDAYDGGTQGARSTTEELVGKSFPVILYNDYSRPPDKQFRVSGYLGVELVAFCGAPDCSSQSDRWFEFRWGQVWTFGEWADDPTDSDVMQVRICDVDNHPDGGGPEDRCT